MQSAVTFDDTYVHSRARPIKVDACLDRVAAANIFALFYLAQSREIDLTLKVTTRYEGVASQI